MSDFSIAHIYYLIFRFRWRATRLLPKNSAWFSNRKNTSIRSKNFKAHKIL